MMTSLPDIPPVVWYNWQSLYGGAMSL